MKRIILTVFLVFGFCYTIYPQAKSDSCPKIKIESPKTVPPNINFKAFAVFENENQPSISKFNWTIIKGDNVSKEQKAGIIEVESGNIDGEWIIFLAESLDENCQNPGIAKSIVVFPVGTPLILEDYSPPVTWIEEKARLEYVAHHMQNNKDKELLAFLSFDKKSSPTARKNYLLKILRYLSEAGRLDKRQITFLISESKSKRIYFRPVSQDAMDVYYCDDCLIIKAEDFEKLENLFRP